MRIRCGQCGEMFEAAPHGHSPTVTCPNCSRAVPIPGFVDKLQDTSLSAMLSIQDGGQQGFAELAKKGLERRLHVTCGACGKHLTISGKHAGQRGHCPACKARIQIPEMSNDIDIDLPLPVDESQAAQLDLTESAHAIPDSAGLDEVVIDAGMSRKERGVLAAILVAVLGLAVGLWIGMLSRPPKPPATSSAATDEQPRSTASTSVNNGSAIVATVAVSPEPAVTTSPSTAPVVTQTPPTLVTPSATGGQSSQPAAPVQLAAKIVSAQTDVFAVNGYLPAKPGFLYWRVTVSLTAGDELRQFSAADSDVTLTFGATTLPSLGLAADTPLLGTPAKRKTVRIEPGQTREFTFVFEIPDQRQMARLNVKGFPEISAGWFNPSPPPDAAGLVGAYEETAPRNLQPMLANPVMRAVQSAGPQRLTIRNASDGGLTVAIAQAGVSGAMKDVAGQGINYQVQLNRGGDKLACRLRVVDGGKMLVLYLSDEPFHQLTYVRK